VDFNDSFWTKGGYPSIDNPWRDASVPNAAPFDQVPPPLIRRTHPPPSQPFYIILNVAVGGLTPYFPDGVGGKPWANGDPDGAATFWRARGGWLPTWEGLDAALQVDWVRVKEGGGRKG
jgi:hypothetical protein